MDQTASTVMLKFKVNQNLVADLEASKYNPTIRLLIECLKYSTLMKALSIFEKVPLSYLSEAYSTAIYHNTQEVINFEVYDTKLQSRKWVSARF